ncbi:MAG TPA: hypothetical protein GX505_03950 [Clostridiales bacterium]|nr:hypothetical protein [Clostridiales bacterium]
MILLISLAALGLSYLANKLLLKILKEYAVIIGAPVTEEILKTLPAYFLNRPVLHVHILFGIGEAIYDFLTGARNSGRWAAAVSIVSHSVFGGITLFVLSISDEVFLSILCAIAAHCIWNLVIMRAGRKDKPQRQHQ